MSKTLTDFTSQIYQPIFFITPEVHWALGLEDYLPDYYIICLEDHPIIELLIRKKVKVFCIQREHPALKIERNTGHILHQKTVQDYIVQHSHGKQPAIMYFKPLPQIDKICQEKGFLQIGNTADVARRFEEKFNLIKLGDKNPELHIVPSIVTKLSELSTGNQSDPSQPPLLKGRRFSLPALPTGSFAKEGVRGSFPLVIQTSRSWAGKGTYLVKNEDDFNKLKSKLGNTKVKVSPYLQGKTYLNNACIFKDQVLQSPPALQINCPNKDFSSLPLATCGRQWPAQDLNSQQIIIVQKISENLGQIMSRQGYQGYFGLDFLVEEITGEVYLLEINARMTASTSFYTQLEIKSGVTPLLFYHILNFLKTSDKSVILNSFQDPYQRVTPNLGYKPMIDSRLRGNDNPFITGSQLILRNNQPQTITIKKSLTPGIYQLTPNARLKFIKAG